jgi:AraC-like DNA-binding protein
MMKNHADEMFKTGITLTELAETYNRNEKYMGRLFKEELGVSFAEYKQNKRLELAEALLIQGEDRIIDIAFECGFNNISYFNRAFQKKYGMSPTAYRKNVK